jgi:hypothetical protein
VLTGDPVAPEIGQWSYSNAEASGPGGTFSSDTALADAWISIAPGSPQCGGTTMVGLGGWETHTIESFYGNTVKSERREYQRTIRNFSSGVCHSYQDQLTFQRTHSVSCPKYYVGAGPVKPGCKLNFEKTLLGMRNNCEDKCKTDDGQQARDRSRLSRPRRPHVVALVSLQEP